VIGLLADGGNALWQLEQLADRPAWLNVAAVQEIVPWQVLQSCELAMCRSGLPAAITPL